MRPLLCALILALATPAAAAAELTTIEKTEAREVYTAADQVLTALWYLGSGSQETTVANRAAVKNSWVQLVTALKPIADAIGLLVGAPLDEIGTWEPQPRSAWLAGAWQRLDSATTYLLAAESFLLQAETATVDPARKDDFFRARTIWSAGARTTLAGVDRTQPYLDPCPIDCPQVVGPHGLVPKAGTKMVLALRFGAEALDHGATLYMQNPNEPFWSSYDWSWRLMLRMSEVLRKEVTGLVRWAMIPVQDDCTAGRNRFHLVANGTLPLVSGGSASQEPTADGLPYHLDQLLVDVQQFLIVGARTNQKVPLSTMLSRIASSWRYSDWSVKAVLEFADPTKLDGVGNSGAPGSPFGPPLC
jgi:hypothetical protein